MLQKGCKPSFAIPPEKVTAWPSAIPTSKARLGILDMRMFIEQPEGMAGVTPTILGLASASSTSVFPKTSWNRGGIPSVLATKRSPVTGSINTFLNALELTGDIYYRINGRNILIYENE